MYVKTLGNHRHLKLVGVFDSDPERTELHSARWGVEGYESLDSLLAKCDAKLILNLTNPRSHFDVTHRCLSAGKHVYSEKPLGMTLDEGRQLDQLAKSKGLLLGSAPCSWLSESAATIKQAIDDGMIGDIHLVYANFDDGLIAPNMAPWSWRNDAGIAWPAKDEFEIGCTFEHAGYMLTWLAYFFGPAKSVTSFASCQIHDKGVSVEKMAPDFSVGCITYDNNVVARVTCGLVAPRDKSLMIVGDRGIIYTPTVRSDVGPVYIQTIPSEGRRGGLERRMNRLRSFLEKTFSVVPWSGNDWQFRRKLPLVGKPPEQLVSRMKPVDFLRGPAEMALALEQNRHCRINAEFGLHILELTQELQHPSTPGCTLQSQFARSDLQL